MATVEYFFDFGSPTAYFAHTQLPAIAQRTGGTVVYRPMLLGGVMKAVGNQPPGTIKAKGAWMTQDLARYAAKYGIAFKRNPFFPVNTMMMMRGAMAAERLGRLAPYCDAMFHAMWVEPKNMAEPALFASEVTKAGFDAAAMKDAIESTAVKDALRANTEEAIARGAFGAPTFFVDDEMHFGQDRLEWVEAALSRKA